MSGQMLLSQLLDAVPPEWDRYVSAISQDSRILEPGSLFLARAGLNHHGLDFLKTLLEKQVAAIAAEPGGDWDEARIATAAKAHDLPILAVPHLGHRASQIAGAFFGQPSRSMKVMGITGTNGKTSCALGLAQAMEVSEPCLVIGTLGHGRPSAIQTGSHTTPDAVSLQAILSEARDAGIKTTVMEVSSHALDQGRVEALDFDTAVFTNLSRDHLDYHGDMQSYGRAKARLFEMPGLKAAVINADDAFAAELVQRLASEVRLALYGAKIPAALATRAELCIELESLAARPSGLQLALGINGESLSFDSHWLGLFNAHNLMAMLAVLLLEGLSTAQARQRLAHISPPPGRMEAFGGGSLPLVVVDYAHTPDALEQVLKALRPHCSGRLALVFGCGGGRDKGKRPLMGAIAERLADRIILTNDNSREEPPEDIIEDIRAGMKQPNKAEVEPERASAIRLGLVGMGAGDLLAVCGKGHETSQQIGTEIRDFSDRLCVEQLLMEMAA